MNHELVIVLDFGGQYNQLIARRIRENKVYCEVHPWNISLDKIKSMNPKAIVFTGGPSVVSEHNAPIVDKGIFDMGIPILGICYGCQLIGYVLGAPVEMAEKREYGKTDVEIIGDSPIFRGLGNSNICWMSHTYHVREVPLGFDIIAGTDTCKVAAMQNLDKKIFGVQFHPEVSHTINGDKIIHNFLYNVAGCSGDWVMDSFANEKILELKQKIGDRRVLCALSGGVDSSVAAILINKAVGKNLTCIFVDHGFMRKGESDEVEQIFTQDFDINFMRINAADRFLEKLSNISDPEEKRKIIGEEFIRVFEEEANKLSKIDFLVQGTIYPDVIESGLGDASVIKSHHNVGGLPDHVDFEEIIEPLRDLFKDEVRKLGYAIGIPSNLVERQPFPGPGLAIRIIGDITQEKLEILRDADCILRQEIAKAGLDRDIGQYFAVLTNVKSVGVMGDERTYSHTLVIRAVSTTDFMTADWYRVPYDVLETISTRIVNEVAGINRICYDITSKPPATIEWE